ncbi:MAG: hypothetical protein ACRC1P_08545 [Cellulosilyticaceae bacterium]
MSMITQRDREIVRDLAKKQLELAHAHENEIILKKWHALGAGKRENPTVRFLFSNFANEVIDPLMQCETDTARKIEYRIRTAIAGQQILGDDTPIASYYPVGWHTWVNPFNISPQITHAEGINAKGFHIEPVISDIGEEIEKISGGYFGVDKEGTLRTTSEIEEIIGDILPVKMTMGSLGGSITNPLVHLTGMENYYLAMYDSPEAIHKIMDRATKVYEDYYDFLEKEGLLLPTYGMSGVAQESFAFNHELPSQNVTQTNQCWGFLESQETTAVSPDTFGEFVFPYQDRLVKRFGLLSYGCCERVDAIFPEYLSKWKNLRKLSVSPFNNEMQVGEYLRGSQITYYSKPRAEFVTNLGPLDEAGIIASFKGIAEAASGCMLEVAQREVCTIYGDCDRAKRYVELAKYAIEKYWKP